MYRRLGLTLLFASAIFSGAGRSKVINKIIRDRAHFADPALVAFVRPGLVIQIIGASIGSGGTITANFTITDHQGLALDIHGVTTPGPGQRQFRGCIYS
jgi:hypothetical protein